MWLVKKIILIIFIFVVFGVGAWIGEQTVVCPICPPKGVDFSLLWEAWNKLQENYVNPEELDTQ